MGDYLEDLVARQVTAHVGKAPVLKALPPPEFTAILNYFPLDAINGWQMTGAAWPIIDGQLSKATPVGLTSTHFSAAYARFLGNVVLVGDGTPHLVSLAKDQTAARTNTTAAAPGNGGLCLASQGSSGASCNYVPGYATSWHTSPGLPALSINLDVWRARAKAPWQAAKGQNGGQSLRATLIYSDFRIVVLTPAPLQGGTGWYSPALLTGMRDGQTQGVTFNRQTGFGDTSGFIRAQAFAMVGRVQFRKQSNSTLGVAELMEKGPTSAPSSNLKNRLRAAPRSPQTHATTAMQGRLRLSENLFLPHGRIKSGWRMMNALSLATSWDTGNLYALTKSGFIVCAVPDAPLTKPPNS